VQPVRAVRPLGRGWTGKMPQDACPTQESLWCAGLWWEAQGVKGRAQTGMAVPEVSDRPISFRNGLSARSAALSGAKPWAVLAALVVSFVVLESFLPRGTAVKIGADEDFELSKVTLVTKGYKLYTEIWNDQPPLNTSILISLVHRISPPILGPRLMSVTLALVLLSSFFIIALRVNGLLVATLATGMLVASPGFIELSSSCMQEIPALASVVAAMCVLVCFCSSSSFSWFASVISSVLAGLLFGLGLQLKLSGTPVPRSAQSRVHPRQV